MSNLLKRGLSRGPSSAGVWADMMGSGTGAFTLALAELLGPGGQIHTVDKDRSALRQQKKVMASRFPATIGNIPNWPITLSHLTYHCLTG